MKRARLKRCVKKEGFQWEKDIKQKKIAKENKRLLTLNVSWTGRMTMPGELLTELGKFWLTSNSWFLKKKIIYWSKNKFKVISKQINILQNSKPETVMKRSLYLITSFFCFGHRAVCKKRQAPTSTHSVQWELCTFRTSSRQNFKSSTFNLGHIN